MSDTTDPLDIDSSSGETSRGIEPATLVKTALAAVPVIAFVVFAIQNSDSVEVDFLTWTFSIRQIFLMVLSAVVGIIAWELARLMRRRARRS